MEDFNSTDIVDVSFFQGQYVAFYIIISLVFVVLTCLCADEVFNYKFYSFLWACFLFLVVYFALSLVCLGVIYGPILFFFNLTFKENFEKGCRVYFYAYIYSNLVFPIIFLSFKTTSDYLIHRKLFEKKRDIENIKESFKFYCSFVYIFVICSSCLLYFSKGFIDFCEKYENELELQNYILASLVTYFTLNLVVMTKDKVIVSEYDDRLIITLFSFYLFTFSLFAILLQQLTMKDLVSREVFYTVLMFSNFFFIPTCLLLLILFLIKKYVIGNKEDLLEFRNSIGKNKVSFLGLSISRLTANEDTLLWKEAEKNSILKEKELV